MSTHMPELTTDRLVIRAFVTADLDSLQGLLDPPEPAARDARQRWLEWAVRNYGALAALGQPPYGDRAITLREGGELVGMAGLVPALGPFRLLPSLRQGVSEAAARRFVPEVGLFWELGPAYQGKGYATEAARALVGYGFDQLNLRRVVATTTYDNVRSIAVMRRLGMRIERNPEPAPAWFQVVGILDNN